MRTTEPAALNLAALVSRFPIMWWIVSVFAITTSSDGMSTSTGQSRIAAGAMCWARSSMPAFSS